MTDPIPYDDFGRFQWLLDQFHVTDNAWMASFCFSVDQRGIRAAIDKEMAKDEGRKA